ncbi:dual-specificity RNA methyltransferase RlmN-like isoform X2 [Mangifera indica]|uniref:dual-specificity RNA methyltransferase RlmN-like isoform X2 n=1 Tax=Mangifera indica TaxID=29780 RepID=UPI001CFC2E7A|nr:dual-specificity RNA methyltransferase RlmN-like isoform X2 [Mangifera indica]
MRALGVYQKNSQQKVFIEYILLDKVNDEEPHAHQLGKLLETSQVVTIDVASPEAACSQSRNCGSRFQNCYHFKVW